jgi:hypothetical protein
VKEMKEILEQHPGRDKVFLEVTHEDISVPFRSVNGLVHVSEPLVRELKRYGDVQLGVG